MPRCAQYPIWGTAPRRRARIGRCGPPRRGSLPPCRQRRSAASGEVQRSSAKFSGGTKQGRRDTALIPAAAPPSNCANTHSAPCRTPALQGTFASSAAKVAIGPVAAMARARRGWRETLPGATLHPRSVGTRLSSAVSWRSGAATSPPPPHTHPHPHPQSHTTTGARCPQCAKEAGSLATRGRPQLTPTP